LCHGIIAYWPTIGDWHALDSIILMCGGKGGNGVLPFDGESDATTVTLCGIARDQIDPGRLRSDWCEECALVMAAREDLPFDDESDATTVTSCDIARDQIDPDR
jgi:hypothetical protein